MKKIALFVVFCCVTYSSFSQIVEILRERKGVEALEESKPDKFSGLNSADLGYNFGANNDVSQTVQLIRIWLGDPKGFHYPLYLIGGLSEITSSSSTTNLKDFSNLIKPTSGIMNLSISANNVPIFGWTDNPTKGTLAYQVGIKLNNGNDTINKDRIWNASGYADLGIYLQTGAFADDNNKVDLTRQGIAWLQIKGFWSMNDKKVTDQLFGPNIIKNNLIGLSIYAGAYIEDYLSINFSLIKAFKTGNSDFEKPYYRFSFSVQKPSKSKTKDKVDKSK
jgi:hypothetical protein